MTGLGQKVGGEYLRCWNCYGRHEVPLDQIEWMGDDPFAPMLCDECLDTPGLELVPDTVRAVNILKHGPMPDDEDRRR